MIDYSTILRAEIQLVERTIEYFTAESCNPKIFEEIKEIGIKNGKHFNKPNSVPFINLGWLSIFDFSMYLSDKKLIDKGVKIGLVDLVVKLLVEKLIILPMDSLLNGHSDMRYKSNGDYTKYLNENDLILNAILGFSYIIEKYQYSIFKITPKYKNGDISIGTGFLLEITGNQLIITNRHVLENATELEVFDKLNNKIRTSHHILDKKRDLAIIPLFENLDIPTLHLGQSVEILSEIITVGYPSIPRTKDSYQLSHKGEVNSFIEDYKNNRLFLISAKSSSGNSGSPVIDSTGLVVGILTEELFEKDSFEKKGKPPYYAAIPSEEIINFINENIKTVASRLGKDESHP